MQVPSDYGEMLSELSAAEVEYMVVGAFAVAHHAQPRFTKNIDIWVNPTPANAARVFRALARFGAPLEAMTVEDFCEPLNVFQVGVSPVRIDVLMSMGGIDFAQAMERSTEASFGGVIARVPCIQDMIVAKRAAGRPHDLRDVQWLELALSMSKEGG